MNEYDNQLDDVDDLLDELDTTKNFGGISVPNITPPIAVVPPIVTDENLNKYVMDNASLVIERGLNVLDTLGGAVAAGGDVETIDAYTRMLKAVTSSIDVLNKVNIQNKKAESAVTLKSLTNSPETPKIGVATQNITNNITNVVATREEMMDILVGEADDIVVNGKKAITKNSDG